MEIFEVGERDFHSIIPNPYNVFGSAEFNILNRDKCDSIHFLLFKENKYRLGIIGGFRENIFYSPFSAPFGGFSFIDENIKMVFIEDSIEELFFWLKKRGSVGIKLTLPPNIYNESFLSKTISCLFRKNFLIEVVDLNFHFDLLKFDDSYVNQIWYNARKNLKISFSNPTSFSKCETLGEKAVAYDIIRMNREIRGFPLKLTFGQIIRTIEILPSDFFILYNEFKNPIASAIVFHVAPEIVQVIYWGDLPAYNSLKTMNLLSYRVFEYYKNLGKRFVDIGPSTENSIPNYGLCEFKESIGAEISTKLSLTKYFYD